MEHKPGRKRPTDSEFIDLATSFPFAFDEFRSVGEAHRMDAATLRRVAQYAVTNNVELHIAADEMLVNDPGREPEPTDAGGGADGGGAQRRQQDSFPEQSRDIGRLESLAQSAKRNAESRPAAGRGGGWTVIHDIDHEYTNEIICPYCGCEHGDSWERDDSGETECDKCGETFSFSRCVEVTYVTSRNEAPAPGQEGGE